MVRRSAAAVATAAWAKGAHFAVHHPSRCLSARLTLGRQTQSVFGARLDRAQSTSLPASCARCSVRTLASSAPSSSSALRSSQRAVAARPLAYLQLPHGSPAARSSSRECSQRARLGHTPHPPTCRACRQALLGGRPLASPAGRTQTAPRPRPAPPPPPGRGRQPPAESCASAARQGALLRHHGSGLALPAACTGAPASTSPGSCLKTGGRTRAHPLPAPLASGAAAP